MKIATAINAHKILVTPTVLAMMWFYQNWSTEAFIYLTLHGTYTLLWLIKHYIYPDKSFEERLPFAIAFFFVFVPLQFYLIAPYLLISRHVKHPPWMFAIVLAMYILGMFLHYVSDAQKYYMLRERPRLITDGFFKRSRNTNYLGELFIYSSYAIFSAHWLSFAVLAFWVTNFYFRMRKKDKSLSRYPEFEAYRRSTGLMFPRIFGPKESVTERNEIAPVR